MIHDFYLTYDHTLNAELLRACFFSPARTWIIAPNSVPYLNWLLVAIPHAEGWTLEAHSQTFGICIDSEIYSSREAAIEAGPEFVNRWFAEFALMELTL